MTPHPTLQRFYRGGLGSVTEQRDEFARWTGETWPEAPLWLCTFDIVTGRRVVLGQGEGDRPSLPDAMRAASSVPVLYPPVRFGRRLLVDGAVSSSTNVDVAVESGAELIIVAAPMAYDHDDPPPLHLRASKELFDRKLNCELRRAERAGARVLVIRPDAEEAHVHGLNLMRSSDNSQSADLSYQRTRAALLTPGGRSFATAWRAANRAAAKRRAA